ncbi:MAG: hypothetical protein ABIQ89_01345 [Candidatus Saccharimonadales bacterium]
MQLNQPIPPSYPGGNEQYDFILNGGQKAKKSLVPRGGSRKQRTIIAVVGVVVVLFLFGIILSLVLSSGSGSKQLMLDVAKTQTEIVRVSKDGSSKARDSATQSFVQTVNITVSSDLNQTTTLLTKQGIKVDPKAMARGASSETDATLSSAEQAGRYDEAITTNLEASLAAYKTQISQAFAKVSSASQKKLLQQLFANVEALIKNQPTSS